jgi:hypothetical protein
LRVETIKDLRSQVMPRHEDQNPTLREMDTLLEEMNQLNAGHIPDGLGVNWFQMAKNAVNGTNTKEKWTKNDVVGKRATIQQVMCELALQVGNADHGWPEPALDKIRLSLQANSDTKGHIPAKLTYKLPEVIATPAASTPE